jgi:hypothetical protein
LRDQGAVCGDVLPTCARLRTPERLDAVAAFRFQPGSMPSASRQRRDGRAPRTDGYVVCFFQSAQKFKARYATFGFSDKANLDDGAMWPTSFALKELTAAEEARIAALVKKAVS